MLWSKIESHEKAKSILQQQLKAGRIGHAYIFVGKKGIGKKLVAKAFGNEILGDDRQDLVLDNKHPDLKIWETENKTFGVSQIREMQKGLFFTPTQAKRKVIIIDDGEKLSVQAQNALLKILEDPPLDTTFILLIDSLSKTLTTIISRCQIIRFSPLDFKSILKVIDTQNMNISEEILMLHLGKGSINETVKIRAEVDLVGIINSLIKVTIALENKDQYTMLKMAESISNNVDVEIFLNSLEVIWEMALRESNDLNKIIDASTFYFSKISFKEIALGCKAIMKAREDLDKYVNKRIVLETLFIELMEVYDG